MGNLVRLLFAALFATTIVFFWGILSWMKFDWHDTTIHQFVDEAAVSEVPRTNAPKPGMYLLPSLDERQKGDSSFNEAYQIQRNVGPFFFGAVRSGPLSEEKTMGRTQLVHLLSIFVTALLLGSLLWIARIPTYLGRIAVTFLVALFASLGTHLQNWTWFEFGDGHTIASIADTLISWTLGGLCPRSYHLALG